MRASVITVEGAIIVAAGFLLLFLDGFDPIFPLVWSSSVVQVLWSFRREESRYMDELAKGVQMDHGPLKQIKSAEQGPKVDWDDYDASSGKDGMRDILLSGPGSWTLARCSGIEHRASM
jgi:hypothetical protein